MSLNSELGLAGRLPLPHSQGSGNQKIVTRRAVLWAYHPGCWVETHLSVPPLLVLEPHSICLIHTAKSRCPVSLCLTPPPLLGGEPAPRELKDKVFTAVPIVRNHRDVLCLCLLSAFQGSASPWWNLSYIWNLLQESLGNSS